MAEQLATRYGVPAWFEDPADMLRKAAPHVVHVTTPPQSHFSLARQCIEAGSHVYLEKPFTVNTDEAESLINLAERRGVKVTAGHNYQFTLEMLEMRRLVRDGFLGGRPVHVESHWGYDLSDTSYVGPMLGSPAHWVRQLPGQLLHNVLSHGIAKIAEFLGDELAYVAASAHQSPQLRKLGGLGVLDELRVSIRDKSDTTAFFSFSTQIKPGLNQLRLCGPTNSILVDQATGSVIRYTNRSYKSYLTYFVPPLKQANEHLRNARHNVVSFLRQRLHQDGGMKELIEQFYRHVGGGSPQPIPYREIVLTARIMDEIFGQIYPAHAKASAMIGAGG